MSAAHRRRAALRRPVRALRLALVGVLLIALTACSNLPRSSDVMTAEPRLPAPQAADFYAGAPRDGASPTDIVADFLRAQAAGYAGTGFDVARQYLMPDTAAQWQPEAPVRVYAEGPEPQTATGDDGGVVVSANLAGTVDERGTYTVAAPGTSADLRFSLVRNGEGQWRIAELDDGVLLSSYVFSTVYSSQPLYFLTLDRSALVPDLRWFPRDGLATSVVDALLEGPAPRLADVVATELPADLDLTTDTVEIADGVAAADLTAQIDLLGEPARSLAGVQLERTLFGVATVREVVVTSGGERIAIDPGVATISSYPLAASATPIGLRNGGIVRLGERGVADLVDAGAVAGTSPGGLAQTYDGNTAVVLDEGRRLTSVDLGTGRATLLLEGSGLVNPSIDREEWVWTAETAEEGGPGSGALLVVGLSGERARLAADWLDGRTVTALAVSREGARIAVASTDGTSARVDVAGILRDRTGQPTDVTEPSRIGSELADAIDLTWVEDVLVAALGRTDADTAQPVVHLMQLGGPTRQLPLVDRAASVTASRGARSLLVGTTNGEIWVRNGAGWRVELRDSVADPSYPG